MIWSGRLITVPMAPTALEAIVAAMQVDGGGEAAEAFPDLAFAARQESEVRGAVP